MRIVCLLAVFLSTGVSANGESSAVTEYDVKALYLRAFIRYIDWPRLSESADVHSLVIGIVNRNPFGGSIAKAMEDASYKGRKIVVELRSVESAQDALGCHIVFFAEGNQAKTLKILEAIKGREIFTIMDSGAVGVPGAILQFVNEPNGDSFRVRFDVNLNETGNSGLRVGSQMLQHARRVIGRAPEKQML